MGLPNNKYQLKNRNHNMSDYKIGKIKDPTDPNRCQAVTANGQCTNTTTPHSNYCAIHGGNKAEVREQKTRLRNYQLQQYRQRTAELSSSNEIKSLRDEIGILRMMLEQRINSCSTDSDLMVAAPAIGDMVMKVERLVTSCHKLEGQLGNHLDKQVLISFAQQVIQCISNHVEPDIAGVIADEIIKIMAEDDGAPAAS